MESMQSVEAELFRAIGPPTTVGLETGTVVNKPETAESSFSGLEGLEHGGGIFCGVVL